MQCMDELYIGNALILCDANAAKLILKLNRVFLNAR